MIIAHLPWYHYEKMSRVWDSRDVCPTVSTKEDRIFALVEVSDD